jgi:hypothetical protein
MPRFSVVLKDAMLLRGFLRVPHCSVVLKDATLLHDVE